MSGGHPKSLRDLERTLNRFFMMVATAAFIIVSFLIFLFIEVFYAG
jgi:hypothetical protein